MNKNGNPSVTFRERSATRVFERGHETVDWVWKMPQTDLVENYIIDGQITIICSVMVLRDSSIPVPPSDIGKHLGHLLDSTDGTDVSFNVGGETFHAHRAVLAARSPVFRAELLGSMAEATMPSITLHDITPATFKAMLRERVASKALDIQFITLKDPVADGLLKPLRTRKFNDFRFSLNLSSSKF
ncbi:hypothetical protein EJB05_48145, partial [Eragrostis curvula]